MPSSSNGPAVLLFGAGAVGSVHIYILQKAGCTVTAVCRSNYEAAKANGFHIDSKKFGNGLQVRPRVLRSADEVAGEHFDYILVTAKAMPGSEPRQPELLRPAVSKDTTIVLAQNGIGIEDEYRAAFPDSTILSCVVYLPTTQTSPGHVSMGGLELLQIGTFPADAGAPAKEKAEILRDTWVAGGGDAEVFGDIQTKRWSKMLVNATWNPLCALSRSRDVAILESSPEASEFVRNAMVEVMNIAQAYGYQDIDEAEVDKQLNRAWARQGTPGVEPSMMADAMNGRRMEVEAIVGNAVRKGKAKGIKMDRLEALYVMAKALDLSIAGSEGR